MLDYVPLTFGDQVYPIDIDNVPLTFGDKVYPINIDKYCPWSVYKRIVPRETIKN